MKLPYYLRSNEVHARFSLLYISVSFFVSETANLSLLVSSLLHIKYWKITVKPLLIMRLSQMHIR